MRVLFKNPLDSGCGVIKHLVINVLDNNNELITGATKNITYVEGTADYLVNFDNINIPPSKDGYIQVYMVNYDTNDTESELNGSAQLAAYTADRLPIIRNVVMNEDRTLLNCEVITATQLVLSNYIATFNGVITAKYLWTSDNNTPGVAVTTETLENGEYKYVVSINTTIQNCPIPSPLPNPSIIVISNTGAGITYDNVDA